MASSQELVEQRKHKRFRVRGAAFIVLNPFDIGAGRLINISMAGLSFYYYTGQALPIEATELDIFPTDSLVRVSDVQCRSIWDLKTYENPPASFYTRESGLLFGELTPIQKHQLEYFIENHTIGGVEV
jgi:hypothetical protein